MDIYAVFGICYYEPSYFIGVYSSEELAKSEKKKHNSLGFDAIDIIKRKLDEST